MDIHDYPRDMEENLRFRVKLLQRAENNVSVQDVLKENCRRSLKLWVNLFCWTKDPRCIPDSVPFVSYDAYQDQYMSDIQSAINGQYDMLTDKSRDMGVSWMALYVITWYWLFEDGSDFRVGSRKEEYVDKVGVIDTLLEKIRFNLLRQPKWLLPAGFDTKQHLGFMKIRNPERGNVIVGESANASFGSGGRSKAIIMDEFAKWDQNIAHSSWTSTADVTGCRLPVSTPVGSGNKFAMLAQGTGDEKIKRVSLHWTLHPKKSEDAYYESSGSKISIENCQKAFGIWKTGVRVRSKWYDNEADRRTEADLAQEVDINYLMSGYPFFDIRALSTQRKWEYTERSRPDQPIPNGYHITGKIVYIDNKTRFDEGRGGWLNIFELPVVEHQYRIGADTSEGLPKGDKSSAIVRDAWTGNVVATINKLIKPEDFAYYLWLLSKMYNDADLAPENNNHGYSVCKDLHELGCKLWKAHDENDKVTEKRGFSTTTRTRPEILDRMAGEISRATCELRDPVLIEQCKVFVKNENTGKPEAEGSFLDDMVMANAITSYLIKMIPYKPKTTRTTRVLADKMRKKRNAGMGFAKV